MDGVLLDTERVAEGCWKAAEEETGWYMPEDFYHTLIGQSMKTIEPRLREVMHPECDIAAFLGVANRNYDEALTRHAIPVKDDARDFLLYLENRDIPVCLATSTYRRLAARKLEATGLGPLLPLRVCGDEVGNSKPAPDIYRTAADRLGLPPDRLVAVEDSANGLLSAWAAGCRVLHVPDIASVPMDIQAHADRIYRSLTEVRAAMERSELAFVTAA